MVFHGLLELLEERQLWVSVRQPDLREHQLLRHAAREVHQGISGASVRQGLVIAV